MERQDVKTRPLYMRRPWVAVVAAGVTGCLAACGAGSDLAKAPAALLSGGAEALSKVELPKVELPTLAGPPVGTPTEIYTRVGRGAMVCWFGGSGPLKGAYIYHAEANAAGRGDRSEIVIHEKDVRMPDPRGNRAFRVQIVPSGDSATVDAENLRFPIETGLRMVADVNRWARDDLSCSDKTFSKGWDAENRAPEPEPAKKPAKKTAERRT